MQQAILIFIAIANFLVGVYVLLRKPKAPVNRSFFIFVTGITLWVSGFVFLFYFKNFLFDKQIHYGGLIMVLGLFMFSEVFPNGQFLSRRFRLFCLPLFLVAIFVIPFNLLIKNMVINPDGSVDPVNGPLLPFYISLVGIYMLWSLFKLGRNFFRSSGKARMQMKYLLTGISILILAALLFDGLLPSLGISNLNFLGPVFSVVFVAFTAYAIIRHELLDIRVVIQRSLIYFVLLAAIAVSYISLLQALSYLLNKVTNLNIILSAGMTMLLGIIFFKPLEQFFERVTDKIFFKNKYDYSLALHELSRILNTNLSQSDIVNASTQALQDIFKTKEVIFDFLSKQNIVHSELKDDDSVSVPILFEGKNIGAIKLGPKLSGDDYNNKDIRFLETFAHQAAIALEKSKLYEQVREYSFQLEQLVEKRTKEIKDLQEEQKKIMIDISHNLQSPLTIIKGEIDFLNNIPACGDKLEPIKKSIDRISWFIRQLLYLAKLDHVENLNNFKPINFSALVRDQAEYFEVMASEAGVKFSSIIAPDIFVLGSKRLLEEALANLISNAIKYRNVNNQSQVTVFLNKKETSAELKIIDNGIGIASKDLPHIFSRFFRTANAEDVASGIGLGLAIAKKIIERHQGQISISSVLGAGTEFAIVLPEKNI